MKIRINGEWCECASASRYADRIELERVEADGGVPRIITISGRIKHDEIVLEGGTWLVDQYIDVEGERKASHVMFRALAKADVITAADALDNALMFPLWADCIGQRAEPGSYWRHVDKLYRVNAGQGHTIQADWPPDQAASLFSLAANPAEEWPEWIQPTGAHNAYAEGAKVTHNGKRWISGYEANTWVPGVFGWEESK